VFGLIITLLISLIYHAVYFYRVIQETRVQKQKLIASNASAQYDALKNQLDPHFLFNSLNVLVSLIEDNPDAAVRFTTRLSKVYRYVLEQRSKNLTLLTEEIAFAKLYVSLLKMRFEEALEVELPDIKDEQAQIVPLSLQLVLENAIKHNVSSPTKPLIIKVEVKNDMLVVTNNLQKKASMQSSSGVGLSNITHRYQLLNNNSFAYGERQELFYVNLPLMHTSAEIAEKTREQKEIVQTRIQNRVSKIRKFYVESIFLAVISVVLIVINSMTSSFPWAIFPIAAMVVGHGFEYMRIFDKGIFWGRSWGEKTIQQILKKQEPINNNFNQNQTIMSTPNPDYERRLSQAKDRVDELRGFYHHLMIYVIVNLGLLGLNYYSNGFEYPWALWSLFGWGLGLVSHALKTYRVSPFLGKDWERRQVEKIMNEENQNL
jgi:hypothetical protein